jgi:hypothetical protein
MKKLLLIAMIITQLTCYTQAQCKYPKGAYMSFDEIVNKVPSQQIDLQVTRRSRGDIKMVGGNDYKLSANDKTVKKSAIRKEICAYSTGDSLYLNCAPYKVQPMYACVISDGDYLVIKAGISANQKEYKEQMATAAMFGAIGGAFAGAQLALLRFVYAIDKKSNKIIRMNDQTLREILAPKPELLNLYAADVNKNSQETLIKYLRMFNEGNK